MSRRVVITGAGVISAAGDGVVKTCDSLLRGCSNLQPLKYLDTIHKDLPCGEVPYSNEELCDILGLDRNLLITRSSLLGIYAAREALKMANLSREVISKEFADRKIKVAFLNGTTVGGMDSSEKYYRDFLNNDSKNQYIMLHGSGTSTLSVAECTDLDYCYADTLSTACSAAANAIMMGADLIRCGRADIVVAGGCECITKYHLNGFYSLMILDPKPCRPFDADRAGLNLGEGAGFIVLESEEVARLRKAEPVAELKGYANACDAFHQTAVSPGGDGAVIAMRNALKMSGLQASQIDYINAHGTGTVNNDLSEGTAIDTVFCGNVPPVSSTKGLTGHPTSAAGGVEAVICLIAMKHHFIPATLRFSTQIPGLSFLPVSKTITDVNLNNVLSNSFGFGGNDTSLIFSSYSSGRLNDGGRE
jgi:3-oxoacyl-[acyl-carrier-protein] synthase-1